MVSIDVKNLCLEYKIPRRFSLSEGSKPLSAGGRIEQSAGRRVVAALSDVNFSLGSGDRLGLVGPNGAGKTTLLKVLYGIYEPTSGSLDVSGRVDALFNISLGFRKEVTGRRNIELRGLINGWSMEEIRARTDSIIEFSELGEFIDMPLKTYSQGMAARLAFSVSTTFEPEILLMDEWIGAGDASFRDKAAERMKQISQKAGIIVLASHNESLIEKVCNKCLRLENGRADPVVNLETDGAGND